jgi:hypothetical protein
MNNLTLAQVQEARQKLRERIQSVTESSVEDFYKETGLVPDVSINIWKARALGTNKSVLAGVEVNVNVELGNNESL